jgi:signal transduction histidine kinase
MAGIDRWEGPPMDDWSALEGLQLEVEELRASRARVLAVADAERRRIERDLHDGVQQHLVALVVNLQLARDLADVDPEAAKVLLHEVSADAREALESVRALAYRVYPPLLRDRGVVEAVRATAAASGVRARLTSTGLGRHPPDVEITLYFACVEALDLLSGLAAPTSGLSIRLWQDGDAVFFAATAKAAALLASDGRFTGIRDRVDTLGGRLVVSQEEGSLTVSGRVPAAP